MEKTSTICCVGRRKTSVASISLVSKLPSEKDNLFIVNGQSGNDYFHYNFSQLHQLKNLLEKVEASLQYSIVVSVKGGGLNGQADAIKLGLARALCKLDENQFRPLLKKEGYLSRDARCKERRKYGLKKARKASQSSKR
jgi:small subunit ribosomal protein S9